MYESLGRWQRVRLLVSVVFSGLFTSPLGLRRWLEKQLNDSDVVTEEILRLGKSFPTLVQTLITERDEYMVARLREAVAVLEPECLVCVVGAGHVAGMARVWEQPLCIDKLSALSRSMSGAEVRF